MKKKQNAGRYLDVYELSRIRDEAEGDIPIAQMARVSSLLAAADGAVHWHAKGQPDEKGRPGAILSISGEFAMKCGRCGGPVPFILEKSVPFAFVGSEAEANAIPIVDEELEIVVGSKMLQVLDWVEEEVLLSLPGFARHESCQAPALSEKMADNAPAQQEAERPNPFAVLASLKTKSLD